jgi:hypothetical protein
MGKKDLPSVVEPKLNDNSNDGNGEDRTNEITCCMLDDWMSIMTQPTGGVVLHEFLHWEYLASRALGVNAQGEHQSIRDRNYPPEPDI